MKVNFQLIMNKMTTLPIMVIKFLIRNVKLLEIADFA